MNPHCAVRICLLYAFNQYFDFDFESKGRPNIAKRGADKLVTGRESVTSKIIIYHIRAVPAWRQLLFFLFKTEVSYLIKSVGLGADPGFLAVSPQVTHS